MFLQYLLNKPETFNNHPQPTDPCLDFNYILQNYNSCCNANDKEIGCRKSLCESAYEQYNTKLDEHTNLVNAQNDLELQSTDLQTQNTALQNQKTNLLNKKSKKNSLVNYMEYPGVLSLGDSSQLLNIPGADGNGCLNNISLETAKNTCDDSTDCNSFFSYDPNSNARVCFKSAYGQTGEIKRSSEFDVLSNPEKSSFFVKVPTANVSLPTGTPEPSATDSLQSSIGSPISTTEDDAALAYMRNNNLS